MCYMLLHEEKHIEEPCVDYLDYWITGWLFMLVVVFSKSYSGSCKFNCMFVFCCNVFGLHVHMYFHVVAFKTCFFGLIIPVLLIPCEIDDVRVFIMKVQTVMHQ